MKSKYSAGIHFFERKKTHNLKSSKKEVYPFKNILKFIKFIHFFKYLFYRNDNIYIAFSVPISLKQIWVFILNVSST